MVRVKSQDSKPFIEEVDSVFGKNDPEMTFPIQSPEIDYEKLISKRSIVLEKESAMPPYLLKPEINRLLNKEKHPTYRLIYDLMWSTGARISEVLALTPASFRKDRHGLSVYLHTLRRNPGRPKKSHSLKLPERTIQINDEVLIDRICCFIKAGHYRQKEHLFTMTRQTVNQHIFKLIEYETDAPFIISSITFRHSFAIHLLLNARPIENVAQALGLRSIKSAEIYRHVFSGFTSNFMKGIEFH